MKDSEGLEKVERREWEVGKKNKNEDKREDS